MPKKCSTRLFVPNITVYVLLDTKAHTFVKKKLGPDRGRQSHRGRALGHTFQNTGAEAGAGAGAGFRFF